MKKNISNKLNLKEIMKKILFININNILVEAGGIFFTDLLSKKLVDEIHIFKAPFDIGKFGKPMILNKKINDLNLKNFDMVGGKQGVFIGVVDGIPARLVYRYELVRVCAVSGSFKRIAIK